MKKNRKILNITIFSTMLIMIALVFSVIFVRNQIDEKPGEIVHMNQRVISKDMTTMFTYDFYEQVTPGNEYGKNYAVVTGFNSTNFVNEFSNVVLQTNTDYFEVVFPEKVSHTINGVTEEYEVLEIDFNLHASNGIFTTELIKDFDAVANGLGYDLSAHINKLVVPKNYRKISYGAFNGLTALTDIELPFIGTEREKQGTVEDAFLAVFGSKKYNNGSVTADFQTMQVGNYGYLETPVDHQQLTDIVGYTKWYNYSVTSSNADPTAADVRNNTVLMAYPEKLKNIIITDEYSIDNHAFFYIPNVESIAVQFSEELEDISTNIIDAATVGLSAFANCYWLKTVALPSKVQGTTIRDNISSLSEGIFRQCQSLHTLTTFDAYSVLGFTEYDKDNQKIVIPTTTPIVADANRTSIVPRSFLYGCLSAKEVLLPTDVTEIGDYAFARCGSLVVLSFKNNPYKAEVGMCRIPEYINKIGREAFSECSGFTKIIVPSTVDEIDFGAFSSITALQSITLPFIGKKAGNTGKESLFGYIFGDRTSGVGSASIGVMQNESGDPLDTDVSYFAIPNSLRTVTITSETVVSSGAFMNCSMITSLQIDDPSDVGSSSNMVIGHAALAGCSSLESLSIPFVGPKDVTGVNPANISGYQSTPHLPVSYPSGTSQAQYRLGWIFGTYNYAAFGMVATSQNSSSDFYISPVLKNVSLTHQTVLLIDSFYNLKSLEVVDIGEHTKYSQQWVFGENTNLKSITVPFVGMERGKTYYKWPDYGWLHNLRSDFANAFSYIFRYNGTYNYNGTYQSSADCPFMQLYPNGTGWYSNWAASIPKSLQVVNITDETYFTSKSFRGFAYLKEINIKIEDSNDLKNATFESGCFSGCNRLESLELPFIGRNWNQNSKDDYNFTMGYMFGSGTSGYSTTQYGNGVSFPSSLTRISVDSRITYIASQAFYGMKQLTSFMTDAAVAAMGSYCFAECPKLEVVEMPNAIYTRLPSYAFYNDTKLHIIDDFVSSTATTLGAYSLAGTSIENVDLSKYVSIEKGAFANCLQITSIDFDLPNLKPNLTIGTNLFEGCKNLVDVTLKKDYVSAYMFKNCTSLEGLVYDGIAEYIPEGMFYGCISLREMHYDDFGNVKGLILTPDSCGVTSIGDLAFYGCESLTNFELPAVLDKIGKRAFQNCTGLTMLVIPRDAQIIPLGTKNGVDDRTSGAFYGCNDEFYFEVYKEEAEWPTGWGENWNCYYPVKVIGATTENMFTYAYSKELKGYLITGLNVYHNLDNPTGYKFVALNSLNVRGTLTFPDTYNGVKVYGLADNCFRNDPATSEYITTIGSSVYHLLQNVEKFVLGKNFIYMGESSLVYDVVGGSIFREVYVQNSSSFASGLALKSCGELIYENEKEGLAKSSYQNNKFANLWYDQEYKYVEKAMIFYNEAWKYSGSSLVIKTSALNFTLNATSFTYALGKAINPQIVGVSANQKYIKYSTGEPDDFYFEDRIINAFYPDPTDKSDIDLSPITVTYKNNINVGTGTITIIPRDSRFTGNTSVSFTISQYIIDVGYEAGQDQSAYGVYLDGKTPLGAYEHFANLVENDTMFNVSMNNNSNFPEIRTVEIINHTYNEDTYKISTWYRNQNVFYPNGYKFTGVLQTSASDSGFYIEDSNSSVRAQSLVGSVSRYKDNILGSGGETVQYAVGGFNWLVPYRVYDSNGVDVTYNFKANVTLAVYIAPYVISEDSLNWPGVYNSGYYEIEYTGNKIVPIPSVIDPVTYKKYSPEIEVTVTPDNAIYPNSVTGLDPYLATAKIMGGSVRNYRLPDGLKSIYFVIVKAKLTIDLSITNYIIGELQTQVMFDFDDTASFDQNYSLNYRTSSGGLKGHRVSGRVISLNSTGDHWLEGKYTYSNPDMAFTWDTFYVPNAYGYRIYNDAGVDCTDYFEVTCDFLLNIYYNTFDYNLTIKDQNTGLVHDIVGIDKTIGILSYEETRTNIEIIYGADGYEHVIDAKVNNVTVLTTLTKKFNEDGTDKDNFTFTNIKEDGYVFQFRLEKVRYYTVSKTITLKVVKSDYYFLDISKEYDRTAVDALDGFARLPIDFDLSKVTITYYKIQSKNLPIPAPSAIGSYIFKVVTAENHSEWFNDLLDTGFTNDNSKEFKITQRSIYIDVVDDISPFDSKKYDGEPWKLIVNNSTDAKYNLLPGDELTGYFVSRSSEVGIYDSAVEGTFRSFTPWSVINPTMTDSVQTSNYKIVFRGVYEIELLDIIYTSGGKTVTYDSNNPQYHSIDLVVTEPNFGYRIYFSEVALPEGDEEGQGEWLNYKPYYINPGTYPVYFKIVADNYRTVYGQETLIIKAATMDFGVPFEQKFNYDGFAHALDIRLLGDTPYYAEVLYAVVDPTVYGSLTDEQIKSLNYTTTPPTRTELGTTFVYVCVEARNYQTLYGMFEIVIEEMNIGQGIDVLDFEDFYDGNLYGPTLDFTSAPSDVNPSTVVTYVYFGNSLTDSGVTWRQVNLWEVAYGNGNAHDGEWMLPVIADASELPVKVSVKVLVPGYSITEEVVTVYIKKLDLSLGINNYEDFYDALYHTVVLTPGADCHDLIVTDDLNGPTGTIKYKYYFNPTLSVDLIVRYSTSYNPVIGTLGFGTTVIKEKNVCDKNVFIEVSADNCNAVLFTNGNIKIKKNMNPEVNYVSPQEIQYLARNIEYKDLGITTVHDATPLVKWYDMSSTLEIVNVKGLGNYRAVIKYRDTGNCAEVIIQIDFEVVPRVLVLDYEKELEYDGMVDRKPAIGLLPKDGCTDSYLLSDITNNVKPAMVIDEIGTYPSDYKDVYSGYQLQATLDPNMIEYVLDDDIATYDIIKRKLYITFDIEVPYTGTGPYVLPLVVTNTSSTETIGIPDGEIKRLIYGHTLDLTFETASFRCGVYTTKETLSTNIYDEFSKITGSNVVKVTGKILDETNTKVDYYDLVLDLRISIVLPPLEVEIPDKTVPYNNNYYGFDINILSQGVVGFSVTYWYEDNPANTFTTFSAKDAGTYTLCYRISPEGGDAESYAPAEGKATLKIEKAYLNIKIDEFDEVYDANSHTVGHYIKNSGFVQFTNPDCETYYFDVDEMEDQRVTKEDLDELFKILETVDTKGVPTKLKRAYNLYLVARKSIVNAGDYYAYVYYSAKNTDNYYPSFGSGLITLKRRPLYFINKTPMNPLVKSKIYDGVPLYASLTGFEYDYSDTSLNKTLPDAGLIMSGNFYLHDFQDNEFKGYEFKTASANCKLDAMGEVIPYSDDGDFLFAPSTQIYSDTTPMNLYDNYYPVFMDSTYTDPTTMVTYTSKSVRLTIERAELNKFDVFDRIDTDAVQFNGKDVLPLISTPSDGNLVYFYRRVIIDIYGSAYYIGDIFENQKEVPDGWVAPAGVIPSKYYYEVYVTIERGTNYHEWKGGGTGDYETLTFPVPAKFSGYYFKKAYVEVIPADVVIDWGELEGVYDGYEHEVSPRFKDVATGDNISLIYDAYDSKGNLALNGMIYADNYSVVAALPVFGAGSFGPQNYNFINKTETYSLLARHYIIKDNITTDYLYTYWSKYYTEADHGTHIIYNDEYDEWLDDHTLELTVKTTSDLAGRYYQASHFEIDYEVYNADGTKVGSSFIFTTDLSVLLVDGSIRYNKYDVTVQYDNQYHEANVEVVSHINGYTMKYYSIELVEDADGNFVIPSGAGLTDEKWGAASSVPPKFINVGYYRVYFQIVVASSKQTEIDYVDVHITQADSYIIFSDLGLNRTYDGTEIGESSLKNKAKGGYNGLSSELVFEWFDSSDNPLSSQPYEVGSYKVRITSNGDNNPNYIKNYTPLDVEYFFEITPAKLQLVVNSDLTVYNPLDLSSATVIGNWNLSKNNTHRGNSAAENDRESNLYGLQANNYVMYQISFIGSAFDITTYKYVQKDISFEPGMVEEFLVNDAGTACLFTIQWNAYKDVLGIPYDAANNYELYLDFTLKVHYPYIDVIQQDKAFDYDSNAKKFFDGTNASVSTSSNLMEIITPTVTSTDFGDIYSVYYKTSRTADAAWIEVNSVDDLGFTTPGTYHIYYKIEFDESKGHYYAPFESEVIMRINFQKRTCTIEVDDKTLVYNGQERGKGIYDITDGTTILDYVTVTNIIGDTLPAKSSWGVKFYDALYTASNGWIRNSDPMDTIIDQGDYLIEITIPQTALYAETTVRTHFEYTRRMLHITATDPTSYITMKYNGGVWTYDAANDPSGYISINNLAPGHSLFKATIVSTESTVGTYEGSSYFRLLSSEIGDFVVLDASGKDVTQNYRPQINDLKLKIEPADVTISIDPDDSVYDYPGDDGYIIPKATLLNPVGYQDRIEYSLDLLTWVSEPYKFREVGTYDLYVRTTRIPNYNDKVVAYNFEITMKRNTVVVYPLDKIYDNNYVTYPTIRTLDGYFDLADPNIQVFGQNIQVVWSVWNDGLGNFTQMPDGQRPINAGYYKVEVLYPQTDSYYATAGAIDFYITPLEINVDIGSSENMVYNSLEQVPAFEIYKKSDGLVISYLSDSIDYEVTYHTYDATGVYDFSNMLSSKPKDVGNYVMKVKLINTAADNVKFDLAGDITEKIVRFNITPREISVKASIISDVRDYLVANVSDLTVVGLPSGLSFASSIRTVSNVSNTYSYKGVYSNDSWAANGTLVWVNGYGSGPAIKFADGSYDSIDNYKITVDVTLVIANGVIPYRVSGYDEIYDGKEHSIDFEVLLDPTQYSWEIEYRVGTSGSWVNTLPVFTNAMTRAAHIFVRVMVYEKLSDGTEVVSSFTPDGPIILDEIDDGYNLYDQFNVMIRQAETVFDVVNPDLNKVYDAKAVTNPTVEYNFFESDNRDSEVMYDYFVLNPSTGGYQQIAREDVVNAGTYRLVVWMTGSTNYKPNTPDKNIEIDFVISKRKVYIKVEGNKVYDALELQIPVTNANVVNPGSSTNTGLVSGHSIAGTILTMTADAGHYTLHEHFKWHNSYEIVKSGYISVKNNYEVSIYGNAIIDKADFDYYATPGGGPYISDSTYYYITVDFNTTPLVPAADMVEIFKYTLNQNPDGTSAGKDLEDPASYESSSNIGINMGTVTVYFMISAKNYNPVFASSYVTVTPQNTDFRITDWDGKTTDLYYTANPYDVSSIRWTYTDDDGNDLSSLVTPRWEFYTTTGAGDPSPVSMGAGVIPYEAGTYAFKGFIAPISDAYSAAESVFVYFTILPHKVTITWDADRIVMVDVNKYNYYMYYTGSQVNPTPYAENLAGLPIPFMVQIHGLTGMSINVGKYTCEAIITDPDMAKNYDITYVGSTNIIQFEIISNSGLGLPPIDPDDSDFPPYLDPTDFTSGCKYIAVSITFDSPQVNPDTGDAYEFGEVYVVVANVIFKCLDCGAEVNATLVLHMDSTGEILTINGYNPNRPLGFMIEIFYDDPLQESEDGSYYYHIAQARLKDPVNLRWDISYQFATPAVSDPVKNTPIDVRIKVELKEISRSDVEITYSMKDPDTGLDVPLSVLDMKFAYTGSRIEFDVHVTIKVTKDDGTIESIPLTRYIPDTGMVESDCDYRVYWYNNINPTDGGAYLCVESIPASGYKLKMCDEPNREAGDATDHTQNFTIYTELPFFIQFKDPSTTPHNLHFRKFELDVNASGVDIWKVSLLNYDDRVAIVDPDVNTNANTDSDSIRLTGLYQGMTLDSILSMLENPLDRIRVELNSELIYNGKLDKNNTQLTDGSGAPIPVTDYLVRTGLKIILYEDDTQTKSVDSIETILFGDVDSDGEINVNDLIVCATYTTSFAFDGSSEFQTTYQAGRCCDVELLDASLGYTSYEYEAVVNVNDIIKIASFTADAVTGDINAAFAPTI